MPLKYAVVVQQDGDGDYVIHVPDLPGCATHGTTLPEAFANLDEVQRLWLESHAEGGNTVPEPKFKYETAKKIAKTNITIQGIYDKARLVLKHEPGNERQALQDAVNLLKPLI